MSNMTFTPAGESRSKAKPKPLTDEQWYLISRMLRVGGTLPDAAAFARCSEKRLYRNLAAEVHLRKDVAQIMAKCKFHHLMRVYKGVRGWQSSAWFLERVYRREFALHIDDASKEERAIQVRKLVRRQGPIPAHQLRQADMN